MPINILVGDILGNLLYQWKMDISYCMIKMQVKDFSSKFMTNPLTLLKPTVDGDILGEE